MLGRLAAEQGELGVLDFAQAHGLLPQLTQVLARPVREIESRGRRHVYRSLRLTRELLALLDLFEAHDVRAIPFKGPVLAVQLYGNPAARFYGDLDFLIPEHQVMFALALLRPLGHEPLPELRRFPYQRWRRVAEHVPLVRQDGDRIDLHWKLGTSGFPFPLDFDALWSRREAVQLGGRTIRTVSREDLVLYLAAHGAEHAWERLEWVFDFAHLVCTSPDLDWAAIAARARAHSAERGLLLAVRLGSELLGAATPPVLARRIARDRKVRMLADRVRGFLVDRRGFAQRRWTLRTFHLAVLERLGQRARYLSHVVFSPGVAEWELLPLPERMYWLYYLVRLVRLAGLCAQGVLKRVRRA